MFDRVIAGIDGTRASFDAGRQASRLTRPSGSLTLLAATDPYLAVLNRWGPRTLVEEGELQKVGSPPLAQERLVQYADESLADMRAQLTAPASITQRVVDGAGLDALRRVAESENAQLIALGDHGYRRLLGIARSSTATELLHEAPCSVLIARRPFDPAAFPARLVVGVDSSDESLVGLEVAKSMLSAMGGEATGHVLVAAGTDSDLSEIERRASPLSVVRKDARAVKALTDASESADLLVVGARGLSGATALGSVSERVAHSAECSVLVVRSTG
ncbi:MAG: universal stress protein [Thermoleophilia bacterium]|nr:universal stress protein [Thermoleophilia bacterium]